MQTKNSDEVFTYLGVKDCGCAVAVAVIKPQYAKENREFINECLDDGLHIERVSLEVSKKRLTDCTHQEDTPADEIAVKPICLKYACPTCSKVCDSESQALNCCADEVREVYVCSVCQRDFDYEDEAQEHWEESCATAEPIASQGVLEAAGQQRMFER